MKMLRSLLALIAALTLTAPAFAAYVNGTKVDATATSKGSITSSAITVTANNLIVALVSWRDTTGPGTINVSVTDTSGDTFYCGTKYVNASPTASQICYAYSTTAGSQAIIATFSTSTTYQGMAVAQYSGMVSGDPKDTEATAATATSTSPRTNSFSFSANDLVVGALSGPSFTSVDSSYTIRQTFSYGSLIDGVVSTSGTGTVGGTATPSSIWTMQAMTFKQAGAPAPTTIAPNNSAIYYSPGTWNVNGTAATTVSAGAYFKTLFTGSSVSLSFDISKMCPSNQTQIFYSIDDQPKVQASLNTSSLALNMPAATTTWTQHILRVEVKSFTGTCTGASGTWLWDPTLSVNSAVVFTGMTLDNSASVALPSLLPRTALILGDSITIGGGASNETAGLDNVNWNDVTLGYAYQLGRSLGTEFGVVGFGGQGWNNLGVANTPKFPSTFAWLYNGVPRTLTGYDYIIINMGQNDGSNNVTTYITGVLNYLITNASPSTKFFIIRPFSGNQAVNLQTAIAASTAPSRFTYIDTTGLFHTALSFDGIHPRGDDTAGYILPGLMTNLKPYLTGSTAPTFRRGFVR